MKTTAFFLMAVVLTWSMLTSITLGDEHRLHDRKPNAKLYGVIKAMPENGYEGNWVIDGNTVNVNRNTEIKEKHGLAAVGRYVEVKGHHSKEGFNAFQVEVQENGSYHSRQSHAKFYGTVEAMPQDGVIGPWWVNGRKLLVSADTRIKEKYGSAAVGAYVEVEGNFSNETFIVYEMEVKDSRYHSAQKAYNSVFAGTIEDMPQGGYEGRWVVAGTPVEVSSATVIDESAGKAFEGSTARVKGVRAGKSISASEIKIIPLP